MGALLIHFGLDDCLRLPVLRNAGYTVEDCPSILRLRSSLIQFPEPDAVAITEADRIEAKEATLLVRSKCNAPIVLFQDRSRSLDTSEFSLVIPPLTDPRIWLADLSKAIERSRLLLEQSRRLRAESATVREITRRERERSALLRGFAARPHFLGLSTEPELIIGYDESSRPVSAACSGCGEEMPGCEAGGASTIEMVRWFSSRFKLHVRLSHGQQ